MRRAQTNRAVTEFDRHRSACWLIAALVGLGMGTAPAWAENWRISGNASQSFTYNSNLRLRSTGASSVWGSVTSTAVQIRRLKQRSTLAINGSATVAQYFNDRSSNSEDLNLAASYSRRYLRGSWGVTGAVRRASKLFTEQTDTGDFSDNSSSTSFSLGSSAQYRLSQRESVSLRLGWSSRIFDTGGGVDSHNVSLGGSWSRTLTPRDTLAISPSVSLIKSGDDLTSSAGLVASWSHRAGPRWNFSIGAGPRLIWRHDRADGGRGFDVSVDINASARYAISQRSSINFSAGSALEPASAGGVQQRFRFGLGYSYRLSQKASVSANGSLQINSDVVNFGNQFSDTQNLLFSASVSYQRSLTRHLQFRSQYSFSGRRQTGGLAVSNAVSVQLVYRWDPRRLRRWRLN